MSPIRPKSAGALASGPRIRNGWAMTLLDLGYRTLYRYGFQAARLVWRVTRPVHTGALVMLWHDGRVLLVRSSYQPGWMAPGGGVEPGERPVDAAARELQEELGLQPPPGVLEPSLVVEHLWNFRQDTVHFFEWRVREAPAFAVDRRELVEARFFTLDEARRLQIAPHMKDYLALKASELPEG